MRRREGGREASERSEAGGATRGRSSTLVSLRFDNIFKQKWSSGRQRTALRRQLLHLSKRPHVSNNCRTVTQPTIIPQRLRAPATGERPGCRPFNRRHFSRPPLPLEQCLTKRTRFIFSILRALCQRTVWKVSLSF